MSKFLIQGGYPLSGTIDIKGAKNHALKLFPLALMLDGPLLIKNVPEIEDIKIMAQILEYLGVDVQHPEPGTYLLHCHEVKHTDLPIDLASKIRASFLFITPLLIRTGEARFPRPGGDAIGHRPIDMTLDSLQAMGTHIQYHRGHYHLRASRLQACNYFFRWITHTGTENLIMAAVRAHGKTVIKNAALEPEVVALCEFLNSCGAKITGIGGSTLEIEGVERLSGGTAEVIPDRIEAGTFAIMAAMTRGQITITNCEPSHLDVLWKYFEDINVPYEIKGKSVTIMNSPELKACRVKTHEYPGFITDLQAPFTVLMTQATGLSLIHETIYDGRLNFVDNLIKMGADIIVCDPHRVLVKGPTRLFGNKIASPDIRAGIAMVLAALVAEGESEIDHVHHIDRGYESLEPRLQKLGARIQRID